MQTMPPPHDIARAAELRDNELESAKRTAQKLWLAVWGLGVLLGVAMLGLVVQGTQARWILRYVEVDRASQQARVIDPAAERYEPSETIAKGTLEGFLKTLRSVSKDKQRDDDDWRALKICLTPTGRQRLREYEAKEDTRTRKYPRAVQVVSRLKKTARTYDFRWQEWSYGANDQQDGPTAFYSASVTFERRDPRTDAELTTCTAGIFLDSWSLGKDQ